MRPTLILSLALGFSAHAAVPDGCGTRLASEVFSERPPYLNHRATSRAEFELDHLLLGGKPLPFRPFSTAYVVSLMNVDGVMLLPKGEPPLDDGPYRGWDARREWRFLTPYAPGCLTPYSPGFFQPNVQEGRETFVADPHGIPGVVKPILTTIPGRVIAPGRDTSLPEIFPWVAIERVGLVLHDGTRRSMHYRVYRLADGATVAQFEKLAASLGLSEKAAIVVQRPFTDEEGTALFRAVSEARREIDRLRAVPATAETNERYLHLRRFTYLEVPPGPVDGLLFRGKGAPLPPTGSILVRRTTLDGVGAGLARYAFDLVSTRLVEIFPPGGTRTGWRLESVARSVDDRRIFTEDLEARRMTERLSSLYFVEP